MKKVISVKEIVLVLISVLLIMMFTSSALALEMVNEGDYANAQIPAEGNKVENNIENNTGNNTKNILGNNSNNSLGNNNTTYPQTGIEDYSIGILLIICVGSAIYAYKKINDYRSI